MTQIHNNFNNEFIKQNDKLLEEKFINSEISELKDKTVDSNSNEDMIWWSTEIHRSYSVLKHCIPIDEKPDYNRSVTLTTQGTYEFLYHIEILCKR